MAMKILRAMQYTLGNPNVHEGPQVLKFIYEFWGYCINGTASLTTPGGLASPTPSTLPAGFLEGSSVLATGSNGVTVAGSNQFTSAGATFSLASHFGKQLVIWKPGSNSGDDSIYQIQGVPNATTLVVAPATGGTPQAGTFVPALTSRTAINYRIVDTAAAAQLAVAAGQYVVFQATPSNVNTGQSNAQFQLILRGGSFNSLGCVMSPLASWGGSSFGVDASTEVTPPGGVLYSSLAGQQAALTLVGDLDFLMCHTCGPNNGPSNNARGGVFHFETPIRLYTQAQDPNPLALMVEYAGAQTLSATSYYSGAVYMIGHDAVTRKIKTLTRCLSGDGPFSATQNGVLGTTVDARLMSNGPLNKIMVSEALFSMMGVSGQFSIGRCKSKNLRFVSTNTVPYTRVGNSGEFIHIGNGVCWPWDGAILPTPLMPYGV